MHAGLVPERLAKNLRRGLGCVSGIVTLGGAGAGAFFAWNIHSVVAASLPVWPFVGAVALAGGVIARMVFASRFASMALPQAVRSATSEMRVERRTTDESGPARLYLVDAEGRLYVVLPALEEVVPPGRYRVFYVSIAGPGEAEGADARNRQAIALEVA